MPDLSLTRTLIAEHSYPTPTRNHLSQHNREAAKVRDGRKTRASEVSIGYRCEDGTSIMFGTATQRAEARRMELVDKALERKQRNERLMQQLNENAARVDSWAHKS